MLKSTYFIRNLEAEDLLENFLVAAVVSLLGIRFYLKLTHYPTIGHGSFHIAHMLWGGLFMVVAILLLLSFLNRPMTKVAAVIGGIGFGAFIDELGKFITSDNNYFYQPTVALIYVMFVLLYLLIKTLPKVRKVSQTEYLINAIDMTKEAIINDLDHDEKRLALSYLKKSQQNHPITQALIQLLKDFDSIPVPQPSILTILRQGIRNGYFKLLKSPWLLVTVISTIVLQAVFSVIATLYVVAEFNKYFFVGLALLFLVFSLYVSKQYSIVIRSLLYILLVVLLGFIFVFSLSDTNLPRLPFYEWGRLVASSISAVFALKGLFAFHFSKLQAYQSFKQSILISIFLTQFFVFYQYQLLALIGFLVAILMHLTVQYLIKRETEKQTALA